MRTAILTDIHANLEALTACISAAEAQKVDRFICLGDTVGYGADPNAACDLVRTRCEFTVLGNHDAAVAGRMDYSYYYAAARLRSTRLLRHLGRSVQGGRVPPRTVQRGEDRPENPGGRAFSALRAAALAWGLRWRWSFPGTCSSWKR